MARRLKTVRIPAAWRRWPELPLLLAALSSQLLLTPGVMPVDQGSESAPATIFGLIVWLASVSLALVGRALALRRLGLAFGPLSGQPRPSRTWPLVFGGAAAAVFAGWSLAAALRSAGIQLPGRGAEFHFGVSALERFELERRMAQSLGAPAPPLPEQVWLLPEGLWAVLLAPALLGLLWLLRQRFAAAFALRPLLLWSLAALPFPVLYWVSSGYGFTGTDTCATDACLSAGLVEICMWWLPQTASSLLALVLWIPLLAWARWAGSGAARALPLEPRAPRRTSPADHPASGLSLPPT